MVSRAKTATADATRPPSEAEMAAVLGDMSPAFRALLSRGGEGTAEWRRYSKQSPWVLRVSQGKRPLFYARPDSGCLKITVLLGGRAVDAALAGRVSKRLQASIRRAKVFPEGRPVSILVKKPSDLAKVEALVALKLEASARSGRSRPGARGGRARG
jgi:hypothetical protein